MMQRLGIFNEADGQQGGQPGQSFMTTASGSSDRSGPFWWKPDFTTMNIPTRETNQRITSEELVSNPAGRACKS